MSIRDATKAWTTVTSDYCVPCILLNRGRFNLVVGSSAYSCHMFIHVNTLVKNKPQITFLTHSG